MTALHSPAERTLCLEYVTDVDPSLRSTHGERYELVVVERGTVQMEFEGQAERLAAGDAVLVAPNGRYRGISGRDSAVWIARFDACHVDVHLPFAGARAHRLGERHIALCAVLRLLAETSADRSAYRRLADRLHFAAIVMSVLESPDAGHFLPFRSNALVREALSIIDRRYAEYIGPADIARELERHPAYLTNLVREATGKSLGAWLIERRLGAASVLLRTSTHSIRDVAVAVGYADVSHFARYFTRRYGTPPARWRRGRSA